MGVRGLSTYVRCSRLGRSVVLKDCAVVIDCWALVHYLYQYHDFDKYYGGQSHHLYVVIRDFITNLKNYNVRICVVRDGSIDVRTKETTKLKRMNQLLNDGSTYPPVRFSLEYYYACIVSYICNIYGCEYFVSTGEADREIAIFSDFNRAYILSNDSDFYIYNSRGGYVSLESLSKESNGPFCGTEVKYSDLMAHFHVTHEKLICFAVACGTDVFQTHDLGSMFPPNIPGNDRYRISRVANYIKHFRNASSLAQDIVSMVLKDMKTTLLNQIMQIFKSYDIKSEFGGYNYQDWIKKMHDIVRSLKFKPTFSLENIDIKKAYIDYLFYHGDLTAEMMSATRFGYIFLTIPPQNHDLYSVNDTSLKIRKAIYRLLYIDGVSKLEVLEYDRNLRIYGRQNVVKFTPLNQSEITDINKQPFIYFLSLLSLPNVPENLKSPILNLECPLLLVFLMKYVCNNTKLRYSEIAIKSLFIGCIRHIRMVGNRPKFVYEDADSCTEVRESNLIHLMGEFITVCANIHTLNLVLDNPITPIPYIYWFDGPTVVDTYLNLSKDPFYFLNELNRLRIIENSFAMVLSWVLSAE